MGQKVHPESIRVGYIHDWKSNWFNEKHFADYLHEDTQIREHIVGRLSHAGLSDITIRKSANDVEVNIHTARPGIVIGKSGSEVDQLRRDLHRITNKQVKVNILEIKRPELDARLVAQSIAEQLQNRVAFRRAMKRALTSAMRSGAKGVKVQVSGRLGGAEMARTEQYSDGRVPLHTLRADIDYGFHEAKTTFGRIGVKCWINKGEIMPEGYTGADLTIMDDAPQQQNDRGGRDGRDNRGGRGGRGGAGGPGGAGGGPGAGGRGGGGYRGGQGGGGGRGPGGPGRGGQGGTGGRGPGGAGGQGAPGGYRGGQGGGGGRGPGGPGSTGGPNRGGQGGSGGPNRGPGGQGGPNRGPAGQGGPNRGPGGQGGGPNRGPRPAGNAPSSGGNAPQGGQS
jgi:small subunit ribosomal protein S3